MANHSKKLKKQNDLLKKIKWITIIFLFASLFLTIITVLGRYVTKSLNDFYLESQEFYFNSDKLTKNGADYQINNWSGVEDYQITINMDSRENNLKFASYDIGYNINYTCSSNIICQISKTEGIIHSSTNTDYFTLTITPNTTFENGDVAWVEITTTSNGEYIKELSAMFTFVVGQENITYQIEDSSNSPYLELNITNTQSYYIVDIPFDSYTQGQRINVSTYINLSEENKEKCYSGELTLSFDPNEVQIDMTDKDYLNAESISSIELNGYQYINEIVIKVEALSSENIRFYKTDNTKDYTYPIANTTPVIHVDIR